MANEVKRATRVSEAVRQELARLIDQDLRDPRVVGVVISRVVMADDLRSTKVYVRLLVGGDDEKRRTEVLDSLARASSLLRREVTRRVQLRYAPDLKFFYDEGEDQRSRIEEILLEIKDEEKGRPPSS